jgi:hypothetical protein
MKKLSKFNPATTSYEPSTATVLSPTPKLSASKMLSTTQINLLMSALPGQRDIGGGALH